jgi:hypothetical protein
MNGPELREIHAGISKIPIIKSHIPIKYIQTTPNGPTLNNWVIEI